MAYSIINPLYPRRAMTSANTAVASAAITVPVTVVLGSSANFDGSTATSPNSLVTFDVQTSNVRVRWDGTPPTSTVGHILYAGLAYTWSVDMWNAAQFIRDTSASADATIFVSALQA